VNQNPFSNTIADNNPFGVKGSRILDEAKEATLGNVAAALGEAGSLGKKMNEAKKSGNSAFLVWASDQIRKLSAILFEFVKRAVQLAIFKFALELCSMAIKALMEALTSRGYGAMDVSTKGVMYHGDGAPNVRTGYSGSPFDTPSFAPIKPW
jgi:hypothetical protein